MHENGRSTVRNLRVVDISGHPVGVVLNVLPNRFEVQTATERLWLWRDCVFTVDGSTVTLQLNRDAVSKNAVGNPAD